MSGRGRFFSWARFAGVLVKEFIQMRRDRVTFAMMIGIPVVQLLLFGYAIDTDPHHLPTLVEMTEESPILHALTTAMDTSEYFDFIGISTSEAESDLALRDGRATVILTVPPGFDRDMIRGLRPEILLTVDASDPVAAGGAIGAINGVVNTAIAQSLTGPLAFAAGAPAPFDMVIHRAFNPEGKTSTNIVPGLLAVILSMTMVMITAVAIVRETERGTMESLIATPVTPAEVMLGKIIPYVFVGYVQTLVFLIAARVLFDVPFEGSFWRSSWASTSISWSIWRSGFWSRPWRARKCRRCNCRFSPFCRPFFCPGSCSRLRRCRAGRRRLAQRFPRRIFCGLSAR